MGTHSYFNYNYGYQEIASDQTELITVRKLNELTDQRVSATLDWQPAAGHGLRAGVSTEQYALSFDLDYTSIFEPGVQEAVASDTYVHSAFVDYELGQSEAPFSGRLGLRTVQATVLEDIFWEPRLNLSYRFPSGIRLKANAGINHQFVNQLIEFEFNGLGVDNQIWALVDGDAFPALRSVQFAAGVDWRQKGWFIDLEGYSRTLQGITSFTPQLVGFDPDEYSQGSGRSFGFDLLLRKQFGNHQTWISYSLSAAQYAFDELSDAWIPAFNDQRHRISWTYLWQKDRWSFSLGWNFQSGKPFTPLESVELDEIEDGDEVDYLAFGELGTLNSARLPAYHRLDLSALYTFGRKNNRGPTYQLGVSLINVYGRDNLVERRYLDVFYGNEE
ncbi:MAG: TonB-dependent receptor, partial [Bacteroidota bacterium]